MNTFPTTRKRAILPDETILADPSDISPISIVEEMKTSYLDYAMSVIVARALPVLRAATGKSLVAYPNAGDLYDPATKTWQSTGDGAGLPELAPSWIDAGACLVGGCCRTRPAQIRQLARAVCP